MSMHLGEATIQAGASGSEVKAMQVILTGAGYHVGPVDGIFGPATQAAVKAFQAAKGLVPDGIVGPLTWEALQGRAPASAPSVAQVVLAEPGMGWLMKAALLGIAGLVALMTLGGLGSTHRRR